MLTKIYINNGFRHNDVTYDFGKGMTGIVGKNESGKSLIAEFVRFALFGSKALRGTAPEYKKLHVILDFVVGDQSYQVERKGSRATLKRGDDALASGTKPVDAAIRDILGYDLNVFDVANACTQGNVEALSSMRPSDRKQMVDRTVGLNQLDDMIQRARSMASSTKKDALAYENLLNEPEAPEVPEGRLDLAAISAELKTVDALRLEASGIKAQLANVPPAPTEPEPCPVTETVAELQAEVEKRSTAEMMLARLKRERAGLEPESMTLELIEEMEEQNDKADAWQQKQKLLAQGHHCCPECKHEWPIANMDGFEDILEEPYPPLNRAQLRKERALVGNQAKIDELDEKIATFEKALVEAPDRGADLITRQRYEQTLRGYQQALEVYEAFNAKKPTLEARLAEIGDQEDARAALQKEEAEADYYLRAKATYDSALARYQKQMAEKDALLERSGDYAEANKRLTELKSKVKSLLLPSLNKVASVLLSQMTGGERNLVTVDEDFEILIDGAPIHTLSGSGKAVANLSIRIALGQILTARKFSVFIGDEVDASMDDTRAEYTAEALRRLKQHVDQVILITHKRPETDHMIELTK